MRSLLLLRSRNYVAIQTIQADGSMTFSTLMFNELKFWALRYSEISTSEIDMYPYRASEEETCVYIEIGQKGARGRSYR